MMKSISKFGFSFLATILSVTMPAVSFADQCAVVSIDQAQAFVKFIKKGNQIGSLCEPCGEVPSELGGPYFETVKRISIEKWPHSSKNEATILINGKVIDLAYTYVQTANLQHSTVAINAAFLVGCDAMDVTNRFIIGD